MSRLEKVLYTPDAFGPLRGHRLRRIAASAVHPASRPHVVCGVTEGAHRPGVPLFPDDPCSYCSDSVPHADRAGRNAETHGALERPATEARSRDSARRGRAAGRGTSRCEAASGVVRVLRGDQAAGLPPELAGLEPMLARAKGRESRIGLRWGRTRRCSRPGPPERLFQVHGSSGGPGG